MTNAVALAAKIHAGAGLFARQDRGRIEVRGADRVRWLNGMVSNDVAALSPGPDRSGCYALLLTPKGRIISDLHVFCREETLWIDVAQEASEIVQARLEQRIIADDVTLENTSADWVLFDLVGPEAFAWLSRACPARSELASGSAVEALFGDVNFWMARLGNTLRLWVPAAARAAVLAGLDAARDAGCVDGDAETLEVLRIEAGVPRLGPELSESVFPEEAGLIESAVSLTKGCYTGQEIVARIESRGQVKRKLVHLAFESGDFAAAGTALSFEEAAVGEITSACSTPSGARGLGFVKLPHNAAGVRLVAGAQTAIVIEPASANS